MPRVGQRQHRKCFAALGAWLVLLLPCLAHAAPPGVPLDGVWRMAHANDTPAQVLAQADGRHMTRFNPAQLHAFDRGEHGAWVVLKPHAPGLTGDRVLSIRSTILGRITLYGSDGPLYSTALDDFTAPLHGHGRIAFELPENLPPTAPILLKFEASKWFDAPVAFQLQSMRAFHADDDGWLVMASLCFGMMLAMVSMALVFGLILRDLTFGWYAGYLLSYVLLQGVASGYLFHPLGWRFFAGPHLAYAPIIVAMTVGFGVLFMLRFCGVSRYAPAWRKPLLWLVGAVALTIAMVLLGVPALHGIAHVILNPLLMLCMLSTLATAVLCALRGSRTAWFFLAGWVPLLVLTTLTSAQDGGALKSAYWLNDATIVAGALEALVLSIGLADRTLGMRRERDRARVLADRDGLTGLLNRRGWTDAVDARLKRNPNLGQVLLFLDLDHFKDLNDCFGHAAGDHALRTVANTLRDELQTHALIGRYGGEEFVVLLDPLERTDAMHIAARLCRRIKACDIPIDNRSTLLSVSIGLAQRRHGDSVSSLVARADAAMYAVKAGGRDHAMWESEDHASAPHLHLVVPRAQSD